MDITVTKKGCTLTFRFDYSDCTYGFLVNKTAGEFSNIEQFKGVASFEVDKDGIYEFVLIHSEHLTLTESGFKIGTHEWTVSDYFDAIHVEGSPIIEVGNFYTKNIFCICKLEKCLLSLQLKVFNELVKNCGKGCKNLDEIKSQRDFLFIANWIMQHLEEYDRFEELYNIYEGIQSCNSLCSDLLKNNKCGCNG